MNGLETPILKAGKFKIEVQQIWYPLTKKACFDEWCVSYFSCSWEQLKEGRALFYLTACRYCPSWQGRNVDSMRQLITLHLKSGRETDEPMGWCNSYSEWVFLLPLSLSRNTLIDMLGMYFYGNPKSHQVSSQD